MVTSKKLDAVSTALQKAGALHAIYQGKVREAEEVATDVSKVIVDARKVLQDVEDAQSGRTAEAQVAVDAARQELVDFQEQAFKDHGIGIDLLAQPPGGSTRL